MNVGPTQFVTDINTYSHIFSLLSALKHSQVKMITNRQTVMAYLINTVYNRATQ